MYFLPQTICSESGFEVQIPPYLQGLELPFIRKRMTVHPDQMNEFPRVEVAAGSSRVGKTTAVEVLADQCRKNGLPVQISLEDWQNNPYLKKQYLDQDPSEALLNSQKYFVRRKYEQVLAGSPGQIFIQDVPPEMDFCYALTNAILGRLKREHFEAYLEFFYSLDWRLVPAPDVLLFLKISDLVLQKRVQASARDFEKIDISYFLTMSAINNFWLAGAKKYFDTTILEVDTDTHNYARIKKEKVLLFTQVSSYLYTSNFKSISISEL